MKLPAYPRTKPSGVEWLGDVPEEWEVKKLGYGARLQGGYAFASDKFDSEGVPVVRMNNLKRGVLNTSEASCVTFGNCLEDFALVEGDLLWGMSGSIGETGSLGNFARVRACDLPAQLNQRVGRFWSVDDCISLNFLTYFIQTKMFYDQILLLVTGTAQFNVSSEQVQSAKVPFPSVPEQQAIAAFLDRETGRLDRLVGRKRELIERLKEKRTALISRTVTRGLPPGAGKKYPQITQIYADEKARASENLRSSAKSADQLPENPPLKPSGLDWLGDIPAHWEAAQLRHKAQILDCKHRTVPFLDDGIPLASIREVHGFEVDLTNAKQTSEEEFLALIEGNRQPRHGDIIYSRNATVGDAALVTTNERFCMGQDVCLIRAPKHHPKYLLYLFRSVPLMEQVESLMIGSTFRRINVGQIHGFWICVPPLPEQTAIAAFLDLETAKLDALVGKIETAMERLQEYRTALITAAVTGKIDVREAA